MPVNVLEMRAGVDTHVAIQTQCTVNLKKKAHCNEETTVPDDGQVYGKAAVMRREQQRPLQSIQHTVRGGHHTMSKSLTRIIRRFSAMSI